tara:strand:+ start:253 stop:1632 length:1380 start_codon:yes stop_codon:yes gene_type:complete
MANGAPTVSNGLVISGVTTSTNVSVASSVTATTFYGSGANLTGITQTAINNNANNRVITGSGTANTLEGEANLTFDGSTLGLTGSQTISGDLSIAQNLVHTGDTDTKLEFGTDTVKLFTAGVQKFRIYDDGVVSIGQSSKSSTVGAGNLDIQGNATNCIIEMGNPFPGFSGGVVPEFRITATNSGHEVKFESVWGGDNALHPHIGFTGGKTHFYRATNSDEIATFNGANLGINETSPDTKLHISHSNATEDVIKLEATPVSAGTGERSRMIFQVTQSNGQSAKLGHIASHSLNNWGGELAFHTKPANGTPNNTTNEVMRMHANGHITQPSQPSFAAYRNQDGYSLNNEVFPFNVTRHNTGSHFNTGNHRFTAPVAGRYIFTFYSILNTQINSGVYSFRVNNSTSYGHNVHFTTVNSSWDHVSTSQIMNLSANDYVTLWSNSNINWHGNGWQIFCGELLS